MTEINSAYNLDAHYSKEMKVERPKVEVIDAPTGVLHTKKLFTEKEATKKIQEMNTDIYEKANKEKAKHGYNRSLYFKIFGGVVLAAAGIAGYDKIRKFFKKP